jgi:aquaporin Z
MKKLTTEFIGAFFLVMGAALGGAYGAALALMVMIYAGGHISGAHYNPAVSVAVMIRGRMSAGEMIQYWIAQLAGAAAAGLIVANVLGMKGAGNCAIATDGMMKAVVAEVLGTFALAYVVLNVATAKANAGNSFYGLAIAGVVAACGPTLGQFSGGAFNPAVGVGLALQGSFCMANIWVYFAGPIVGGALAALVFNMNNPDDK